jgi:hypothetical protein
VERGKGIPKERELRGDKNTPRSPTPVNFFYFHKKKGREPWGGNATSFLFLQENKRGEPQGKECGTIINKKGEKKKSHFFFPVEDERDEGGDAQACE